MYVRNSTGSAVTVTGQAQTGTQPLPLVEASVWDHTGALGYTGAVVGAVIPNGGELRGTSNVFGSGSWSAALRTNSITVSGALGSHTVTTTCNYWSTGAVGIVGNTPGYGCTEETYGGTRSNKTR
jgi:hypothetical protein